MTSDSEHFDQVLADIETGRRAADPATLVRAEEAPDLGLDLILTATGAATFDEAVQVATGRPRAGTGRGPSPVLRARVPPEVKARVRRLATRQHRPESEVVRDALAAYLAAQSA